jgi:hypothetical protein
MRNSRWSIDPVKTKGKIVGIRLDNLGDIQILKALGGYGVLDVRTVCAIVGRSYPAVIARFNKLKRKPYRFIIVHQAQLDQPRMWQWSPQAFHLTPTGEAHLIEQGFQPVPRGNGHFIHTLTQSQTAASFEIGCRKFGLEHVVLDRKAVVVGEHKIIPDGGPIGLGKNDLWKFILFETDCASEPLRSSNADRQAIERKFRLYSEFLNQGLYEKIWGIPPCFILFTTTTQVRMNNMIELLDSLKIPHKNCFGFQVFPTITQKQPEHGFAVSRVWHQIGGTTLSLKG